MHGPGSEPRQSLGMHRPEGFGDDLRENEDGQRQEDGDEVAVVVAGVVAPGAPGPGSVALGDRGQHAVGDCRVLHDSDECRAG